MAIVLPMIAAYASGAVAAVAAGTATLAAYATVAGAVLSTVGAVTGSKDLRKVGAVLSLGGAVGGMMGGMSSAASAGAAGDATGAAATAADGTAAAGEGMTLGQVTTGTVDAAPLGTLGQAGAQAGDAAGALGGAANAAGAADTASTLTNSLTDFGAAGNVAAPDVASTAGVMGGTPASGMGTGSALQEAAQGVDSNSFASWFDRAKANMSGTGKFVKDNKELLNLAGNAIGGMYGPQAEMADMQRRQMDQQTTLMERARANLNAPVRLYYNGPRAV